MRDYSTYITIENNLDGQLLLDSHAEPLGKWVIDAQSTIAAKSTSSEMQVKSFRDSHGSSGKLNYTLQIPPSSKSPRLEISFACPTSSSNELNIRTTSPALFDITKTITSEKPFKFKISIAYGFIKTSCQVTKVTLPHPRVPIKNTNGDINFGKKIDLWSQSKAVTNLDNTTCGVPGSYVPAAVSYRTFLLEIYLDADAGIADVPFKFAGELNGEEVITVDNVFQDSRTLCRFRAKHRRLPWGYAGDIAWFLTFKPTKQRIHINSSRIEVYGLATHLPDFFQKDGILVEFLRHFVLPAPSGDEYPAWIAKQCMSSKFGHQFETIAGAPQFAASPFGDSFRLDYWLKSVRPSEGIKNTKVNCYDQAGLVQLAMSLQLGIPSKPWAYMDPFGYVNETVLIGWPTGCSEKCNNPFFMELQSRMLLPINDPERGAFFNHAFYVMNGKVLDACCGPHVGTEDVATYIKESVDTDTTLYNPVYLRPGTVDDIRYGDGITSLDSGPAIASVDSATSFSSDKNAQLDRIMTKAFIRGSPQLTHSRTDISRVKDVIDSLGGHLDHNSTDIGPLGSETRFIFTIDSGTFTLTLNVCKDHETAVAVMRQHLSTYQASLDTLFMRPDEMNMKGQFNLESEGRSIWIRDNIFFVLESSAIGQQCSIARTFDDIFTESPNSTSIDALVPTIQNIRSPATSPLQGNTFVIEFSLDTVGEMRATVTTGCVLLLSIDKPKRRFKFLARSEGEDTITFFFAHPQTLGVTTKKYEVGVSHRSVGILKA